MCADEIDFLERDTLESGPSDNGAITLTWIAPNEDTVTVLQQSADADFATPVTRYKGVDRGSVLSGLPEGVHYFRIGAGTADSWSKPVKVTVQFFPRDRLFLLLGLGSVVVIATVFAVIFGHFSSRKNEEGGDS